MTTKSVIIDAKFWELFPDAQISVLLATNIDNQVDESQDAEFKQLLADGKAAAKQFLTTEVFSDNSVIQEWRDAFKQFKTKKGARSSIEALLKRVHQDRDFNPINPLVDIYNSVSLKYAVPLGGEDLHHIDGAMHLGSAEGGESFFPLGAETDAPALPGEICYFDDTGAICRCLNWREAQRTMLLETTTDAVLVSEAINQEQAERSTKAMNELKSLIDQYFKIDSQIVHLTKDNQEVELNY